MTYVILEGEDVVNVIVWDGETPYDPENGRVREAPDGVGIGWKRIDGEWVAPPEETQPEETPVEG